jgi:hypothetical protein
MTKRNPVESESRFKPRAPTRNVAPEDRAARDRLPTDAEERYASSHWGVEATKTYRADIPGVPRNKPLVEMGKLLELWVRPSAQHKDDAIKIVFPKSARCHLVFTMDMAERLYCVIPAAWRAALRRDLVIPGGTWYDLNEVALAAGGRQAEYPYNLRRDVQVLGRCSNVVYAAWKQGDNDDEKGCEYIHRFGEESGGLEPYLGIDADGYLWLLGGSYHNHDDGITN